MTGRDVRRTPRTLPAKSGHCFGLIIQTDVGVLHRHPDVAVSGQFSRLWQRSTLTQQLCDVRVATGGMEVCDPFLGLIRNPDPLQILLHHQPRPASLQLRKKRLVIVKVGDPFSQHLRQFRVQRKRVFASVLGASSLHLKNWLIGVQIKALRCQCRKFLSPQSCHVREYVDSRSLLTVVALNADTARTSRSYEFRELFICQRSSLMTNINFSVDAFYSTNGISGKPLGGLQPVCERVDCLHVVIIRSGSKFVLFLQFSDSRLYRFFVKIGKDLNLTLLNNPLHSGHCQLHMFRSVLATSRERLFKVSQVI